MTKGIKSVPFTTPPSPSRVEAQGPPWFDQLAGGPSVISGHGGRLSVRLVVLPSGPVTTMVVGGTLMLGVGTKPPVAWPDVTLTLEYPIEFVVIGLG